MSTILSTIGRIASEFNAARTRYRTERAIYALPIELQKDIGGWCPIGWCSWRHWSPCCPALPG